MNPPNDKSGEGCKAEIADSPGIGRVMWCEPCGLYFGIGQPCPGPQRLPPPSGDVGVVYAWIPDLQEAEQNGDAMVEIKTTPAEGYAPLYYADQRCALSSTTLIPDGLRPCGCLLNEEGNNVGVCAFHAQSSTGRTSDEEALLLHGVLNQARETLLVGIRGTPEDLHRSLGKLNLACKAHYDWRTERVRAAQPEERRTCPRCGIEEGGICRDYDQVTLQCNYRKAAQSPQVTRQK